MALRFVSKPGQALRSLRRPPHQWGLVCWRMAWRVASKPGQALPPPMGTAARPRVLQLARALRSLRRPPHQWGWGADVWLCVSSRSLARPRRRPRAPQPSLPVPPAPSAPVVPGRCCLVRRVLLQTSSIRAAFCADFPALVTNVVNPTAFLRKIVVFGLKLTTFVTRVLTEGFKMRQFDDVCNASLPSAVSPCPVGDAVAADWGGSGGFAALGAGCRRVAGVSHL